MNCELVVFVTFYQLCYIVKFDMFTNCILDSDRYWCICFRCFRNTDIVSVFDFVSDNKYENGNGFSVYQPFPTVFIPTTGYDSIWVIVDMLTKVAHFIPLKTTYLGARLAELYMTQIVCLHGVPKKIVSDRGYRFTSRFWQKLHECLDTRLNFSSAYHHKTDGQIERTNQVLEDMLRACALKHGGSRDKSLP
jgi:hypothetical protein